MTKLGIRPDRGATLAYSRRPAWVRLAIGGTLILLGGVAALASSCSQHDNRATATAQSRVEKRDVPPQQTTATSATATTPPSTTAATPLGACETECAVLADRCGAADSECVPKCSKRPALATCLGETLAHDKDDCGALALCMWADFCGGRPRVGKGTCKTAALCQNACNEHDLGNTACLCECVQDMAPDASVLLWANDTCAGTSCPSQCVVHGSNASCLQCFGLHCFVEQARCLGG